MSATSIEWTDVVWNPITGCTPISAGCANCYAQRMAQRLKGRCGYLRDDPFGVTLHPDRITQPLHWRKSRRVFVCSMSDLFHVDVPFEYIHRVLRLMADPHGRTKQHTFMILTKRPGPMRAAMNRLRTEHNFIAPKNILFGVSVENQYTAVKRLLILGGPIFQDNIRFVNYEPALGPVDWSPWADTIDWLICGGESGPGARPMKEEWVLAARDFCQKNYIPFFFKQWRKLKNNPNPVDMTARDHGGNTKGGCLINNTRWLQPHDTPRENIRPPRLIEEQP